MDELQARFERIGELGRGSTATVWLAFDRIRQERVALKVLHAHLVDVPGAAARLRRELAASARIRHPAALLPYDLHDEGGQLALSMPLHEGETLSEHVATHGPWTAAALEQLLRRLAEVLHAAHIAGVLHRDVSPHNVMVDRAGDAVLTDFGLARLEGGRTATAVVGTPGFAAPEIWLGARPDARADLYGLGAVVWYAATGAPPPARVAGRDASASQSDGRPTRLDRARPDLPARVAALVDRLLDPDPEARPRGAREALDALDAPAAEAPPPPAVALPVVRARLPEGGWRVVVTETHSHRRRRFKLRRALEWSRASDEHWTWQILPRPMRKLVGMMNTASRAPEERLAEGVAHLAALPPGALAVPDALTAERFRFVEGVDAHTAELAAQLARNEGFDARLISTSPVTRPLLPWLGAGFATLLAVLIIATIQGPHAGEDPWLPAAAVVHGLWWIASAIELVRHLVARGEANLPLVYTADLRPFVRPGLVQIAPAPVEPARAAEPPAEGEDPHVARARARVAQARAALHARHSLAGVVVDDLERTLTELERTVGALDRHLRSLQPEASDPDIAALEASIARAQARTRRLGALVAGARDPTREAELLTARAALDDLSRQHERAERAENQRLEAQARLLEVASMASNLHRELTGPAPLPEDVDAALARAEATRRALGALRAQGMRG